MCTAGLHRFTRLGALLGVLVGLLVMVGGGTAHAASASCHDGPTVTYDGSDDAAKQVRALREEMAQNCDAIADRLDALEQTTVECANCAGAASTSGTDEDPTFVRLATSDQLGSRIEQAVVGLAGLLVGVFFGYLLYRQLMPRP